MQPDIRLTRELADQIIFGMENQDHVFYLDLQTETVVSEPDAPQPDRYVELPEWKSADGYHLMERFVGSLRNPVFRERLRAVLASGRGVFRQFKEVVAEREDIERLWFSFKQTEMRRIVSDWVNDLRELWGLERLELSEDEETLPLIASDFVISECSAAQASRISVLDREAFAENFQGESETLVDLLYRHHRRALPDPHGPDSECLIAETPGADLAAVLWAVTLRGEVTVSVVVQLLVLPEYRGLGLARALLREHLLRCHNRGFSEAMVELAGTACSLEDSLGLLGMNRASGSMRVRLDKWYLQNEAG